MSDKTFDKHRKYNYRTTKNFLWPFSKTVIKAIAPTTPLCDSYVTLVMSYLRYSLHKSNNYSRLCLGGAEPQAKILNQYFMKKVKAYQNKISL